MLIVDGSYFVDFAGRLDGKVVMKASLEAFVPNLSRECQDLYLE